MRATWLHLGIVVSTHMRGCSGAYVFFWHSSQTYVLGLARPCIPAHACADNINIVLLPKRQLGFRLKIHRHKAGICMQLKDECMHLQMRPTDIFPTYPMQPPLTPVAHNHHLSVPSSTAVAHGLLRKRVCVTRTEPTVHKEHGSQVPHVFGETNLNAIARGYDGDILTPSQHSNRRYCTCEAQ